MPSTLAGSSVSPGTRVKRTQTGFRHRSQAFGEAKRRRDVAAGGSAVGFGIRALDIEENEVDLGQVGFVRAIAQKSGGLDGRVQAHLLGAGEYPPGESALHHRLATRYGQPAAQGRMDGAKSPRRRST